MLPYARQSISEDDIAAVDAVLRSDWLTTGPKVAEFETSVASKVGAKHAVAVSSGTAALHAAMHALGVGPGDEVIVPAITFAGTANAAVFQGAKPVFGDIDPDTLLLDVADAEAKITTRTKAIVPVDYAGQPCDYDRLSDLARHSGLSILADACHALGGRYRGRPVGSLADLSVFSFHPVKPLTTGEGGMVTTDDSGLAEQMRRFRNHGIASDHRAREEEATWFYEMTALGYNYRITDFQCALGLSQLSRLDKWVARRNSIASHYNKAFHSLDLLQPLTVSAHVLHAYHIYVVKLHLERLAADRNEVHRRLRAEGIGVNVHFIPVYLHPFYRERFGTGPGMCPNAERAYERILTLPLFPAMTEADVDHVVSAVTHVLASLAT